MRRFSSVSKIVLCLRVATLSCSLSLFFCVSVAQINTPYIEAADVSRKYWLVRKAPGRRSRPRLPRIYRQEEMPQSCNAATLRLVIGRRWRCRRRVEKTGALTSSFIEKINFNGQINVKIHQTKMIKMWCLLRFAVCVQVCISCNVSSARTYDQDMVDTSYNTTVSPVVKIAVCIIHHLINRFWVHPLV